MGGANEKIASGAVGIDGFGPGLCAAMETGPVRCWGRVPTVIAGTEGVDKLVSGGGTVCGVDVHHQVLCWRAGVREDGTVSSKGGWAGDTHASMVRTLGKVGSVAVGKGLVCGVSAGRARCVAASGDYSRPLRPAVLETLRGVRDLELLDKDVGCALLTDGGLRCWGEHGWPPPPDLPDVVSVAISTNLFRCAVRRGGTVHCAGSAGSGQLGPGVAASGQWMQVPGIVDAVQVSAEGSTACVRRRSGAVVCWGDRGWGATGDGEFIPRPGATPSLRAVVGIDDAVEVTSHRAGACALVTGGFVKCWGQNAWGALGDGTLHSSATPVMVRGL